VQTPRPLHEKAPYLTPCFIKDLFYISAGCG
jgi:hypothetical protein